MTITSGVRTPAIIRSHQEDLLSDWLAELKGSGSTRHDLISPEDLRAQAGELLRLLADAADGDGDIRSPRWERTREFLTSISASRARQGFTPSETAEFVFSFKRPLFARIRDELGGDATALFKEIWQANVLIDRLGLFTTEAHQKGREEIIARQQHEMLELSTPVVKLWDGVLALPMIGTLDSARTQIVMESLLQRIVETGSSVSIIDITGVPTVDTLVAQHLLKTVAAARLMGTEVIISGVRPQIAQTIVHLGVDLGTVITKANLADAFALALKRNGLTICKAGAGA